MEIIDPQISLRRTRHTPPKILVIPPPFSKKLKFVKCTVGYTHGVDMCVTRLDSPWRELQCGETSVKKFHVVAEGVMKFW